MIRAAFSSLAGAWVARNVQSGTIPEKLAVPLTLFATRLPAPILLAGAIGYGFYRLNQDVRAHGARDVTPGPRRRFKRTAKPPRKRTRQSSARRETPSNEGGADV
jgi:hypothetical protein